MSRNIRLFSFVVLTIALIAPAAFTDALEGPRKVRFARPGETLTQPLVGVRSAGRALAAPDREIPRRMAATTPKLARNEDAAQQASTGGQVKLSGGGPVGIMTVSFDGLTAFWTEDVGGGIFEAFQRPVDGSGPTIPLTPGLFAAPPGVTVGVVAPDDSALVLVVDFGLGPEVISVPFGGGAPTSLDGALGLGPFSLGIALDNATVFFLGADLFGATPATELWVATIGVPLSATQLSGAGALFGASGGVVFVTPTDDSSTLIYATDTAAGPLDFFSVPTIAPGPGFATRETSTLATGVTFINVASDSSTFFVVGDEFTAGVLDISMHFVGGGAPAAVVNTPMAGTGSTFINLSNTETLLGYAADRDLAATNQVYAVSVTGPLPDAGVSLSTPGIGVPNSFVNFNVDDSFAVWESDEVIAGEVELYGRRTDGSEPQLLLHDIPDGSGDGLGFFTGVGYPTNNQRAYYPRFIGGAPPIELHSVRVDGSEPFKTVNAPYAPGDSAWGAFLPGVGQRLTAYISGPVAGGGGSLDRVLVGPLRADLPVEQANRTADLVGGDVGIFDYFLAGTNNHVIFTQDADVAGMPELYGYTLDSDADGVSNPLDNCRYVANGAQGLVPFSGSTTVLALDPHTFSWGTGTYLDVFYAKGVFPVTGSYTTTETGSLFDADRLVEDGPVPAPGTGCWYVFKIDCPGGDWGNSDRNLNLP